MHRTDAPGATGENRFTDGNPATATAATQVQAVWLNAVQEEIAAVIEETGAELDKDDNTQLVTAILALISARLAFTTGDVKPTLKAVADAGWVMMDDGTIGSATSGATTRAHADCEDLFKLVWANITNTWATVSSGRGASAQADWNANKTIALPKALGRALAAAGAGSSLTARSLGQTLGAETHTLSSGEMPSHTHTATDSGHEHGITDPEHEHATDIGTPGSGQFAIGGGIAGTGASAFSTHPAATGVSVNTGYANVTNSSTGGGASHNNMQPSFFVNFMVKL